MKQNLKFENLNIEHLNLEDICRFCLSNEGILLSIYGFKEDDKLYLLPEKIKTLLPIEMDEEDGLPSLICHSCLCKVEHGVNFKNQCGQADSILRKYIKGQTNKENNGVHLKDVACQGNVLGYMNLESTEGVLLEEEPSLAESADLLEDKSLAIPVEDGNEVKDDAETEPEPENLLQMEESMNELEEGMFGNEPFSLDLCSVRLQSESQTLKPNVLPPSSQLTDEDQWSDSASDISEDIETVETTASADIASCNCGTCNKPFNNLLDMQRHQLIHKQEPPYPCDFCDEEFDEKMLLKAHWRSHAKNKPHMCLTCGEAYVERSDLVKHFAVHDMIKPYHCPGCGKAFAYRSDLRKHAIIHTGARPFKCPVCGKTFTRSTNLNKHARVHSGRRPHSCDHCDKMFSSRGDLVRHAVIHTGAKPYACLICSLAFNRKDKLSRHERVHITDRPFVCAECPTSFHRKEELTKHIRFHHFKPDPEYYKTTE